MSFFLCISLLDITIGVCMEKEISETYYFDPTVFNENGKSNHNGISFRMLIKEFERNFHGRHATEYALNLYGNSQAMNLLARSSGAAPFLIYGMELTQGKSFDAEKDPYVNHEMDTYSRNIYVYGIDSAYMTEFDENGYPIIDDENGIYPLTLLIDSSMRNGVLRLAAPTIDDDGEETEEVIIDVPKYEYA